VVKSSKQKLVARSSTEAELIALFTAMEYVSWGKQLFYELELPYEEPALVFQDNLSTCVLAKKGTGSFGKTKHINLRYFSVKEYLDMGIVELEYLPTELMVADVLTKPLGGKQFKLLTNSLLNNSADDLTIYEDC
jgi:hypothetical protein